MYGPTETTVWSAVWEVERTDEISIGQPIDNTRLFILDAALQPVPVGVKGQLFIGGAGLARGYRGMPELTRARFVADPFDSPTGGRMYATGDLARYRQDGTIQVLARMDHQIKLRGFRIELEEIEAVLSTHPQIRAAVAAVVERNSDKRLLAYGVVESDVPPSAREIRDYLGDRLPAYMIPSEFAWIDEIPRAPNGKVDRNQIARTARAEPAAPQATEAPQTANEVLLCRIWGEVLGLEEVGIYDNFFDLGGHSLLSLKVVELFENETGFRMNPTELISQTVRQVAARYDGGASGAGQGQSQEPERNLLSRLRSVFSRRT
jgi:hypothetical protein